MFSIRIKDYTRLYDSDPTIDRVPDASVVSVPDVSVVSVPDVSDASIHDDPVFGLLCGTGAPS